MTRARRPQMNYVDNLADQTVKCPFHHRKFILQQQMTLNPGVQTVVCQYCSRKDQEIGELRGRIKELESALRNSTVKLTPSLVIFMKSSKDAKII